MDSITDIGVVSGLRKPSLNYWIHFDTNALVKAMNSSLLCPAMGYIAG